MIQSEPAISSTAPLDDGPGVRRVRDSSRSIAFAAMPSLVLIAVALLLILVLLPAAIVAAGT
jgi:hypothetical protein